MLKVVDTYWVFNGRAYGDFDAAVAAKVTMLDVAEKTNDLTEFKRLLGMSIVHVVSTNALRLKDSRIEALEKYVERLETALNEIVDYANDADERREIARKAL